LALNPGEQLRLVISGHHLLGGAMPRVDNVPSTTMAGMSSTPATATLPIFNFPQKHDRREP